MSLAVRPCACWCSLLFVALLSAKSADAEVAVELNEQWPNFRGPLVCGFAPDADPPTQWSGDKNVVWKVAIPGKGSSSPIVWGDRLFLTTAIPTDGVASVDVEPSGRPGRRRRRQRLAPKEQQFVVMCLSRDSGEELWKQVAATDTPSEAAHGDNTFASASACTDGSHVVASFGSQGLYCYDMDGELLWQRTDLGSMVTRGSFGEGSSPTIAGEFVILPWDHEGDSYLAALRLDSGETVWKVGRDESTNWATPVVVEQGGKWQVIHSGQSFARGYDLSTGTELWRYSGLTQRPVASPVVHDDVGYFASSRGGAFLGAVRLSGRGVLNDTDDELWTINKSTPDIPSLLLVEDRLYYLAGNSGVLSCANAATGETIGNAKRLGNMRAVYASPVAAAGKIYVTGRDGKTIVLEDNESLDVLAENDLGEPVDATPAMVGKRMWIRGQSHLFCIGEQ